MESLGIAGLISHPAEVTSKYNRLLEQIGESGMLLQIERYLDTDEFIELISSVEDNLIENGIQPYLITQSSQG